MDNYDKTKEYTKYVKPIVSELKKECGLNNIPFLFTAAIKNSESGILRSKCRTRFCTGYAIA